MSGKDHIPPIKNKTFTSRPILVITGPTGTGKTIIADEISQILKNNKAEIISADSRQVYKYLEVGTNLTSTRTHQHLVSFLEPDRSYSAQEFVRDANKTMHKLITENKLPIIVGGTGLYLKALFEGGLTPLPEGNPEI